jgi:ClpP class serine protease
MGLTDVLWIFFMLSAVQPVLRQRLLQSSRMKMLSLIERRNGSRVILLVHRQETMSLLGFPLMRYISLEDSEQVLRALRMTDPELPIDLVLHTPGGLVLASVQIARAIKARRGRVTVYVPHYAMSGGTLIALAADRIVMTEDAVLGPVDPQLGQSPAGSILTVLEKKPISEIDDATLIQADQARKAIEQVKNVVVELLRDRLGAEKAAEIAQLLSTGTWTHDYPLNVETLKTFGLDVSSDMPREILQLMELFPQPVQREPAVTYIPEVRRGLGCKGER